jgi:hypothetical protein
VQHPAGLCEETPFIRTTALDGRKEPNETRLPGRPDRRQASAVLRHLLSSYPELIPDARQAATRCLRQCRLRISPAVFEALIALDLDDLDAGPRAAGYVEPSEAAWAVIENVTAPYFRDLERRVKLRHEDEATALSKELSSGSIVPSSGASSSLNMQRMARPNLPVKRLRSGSNGAATFRFRVRSLRSSHPSGIGSPANGRDVKPTVSPQSPC